MRHEAGTSISEVARQEGVNKSLVKYWIDHAEKFLPQVVQAKRAPAISRLLKRGELVGWKKFVQLISLDKKAIENMDGLKRIEAAEKLKNILVGLAGRGGQIPGGMPEEVIELSEKKARFIARDWFQKNTENNLAASACKADKDVLQLFRRLNPFESVHILDGLLVQRDELDELFPADKFSALE